MASLLKKSFIWISSTLPNPVLTELRNLSGLISSKSILQSQKFSTFIKRGSQASYSATKQFKNGGAYDQQSTGSLEVNHVIQTAMDFDAGRIIPTFSEGFEITGLTGHYSNGNGPYKMSTNFKNDNVVYFNENKWAIWYDSDKNEWVLTNELIKHKSRTEYEFILRNGNTEPDAGTYTSTDGTQNGYTPSSVGSQVKVIMPSFSESSSVIKVAAGGTHTLFLDKSNNVWAVGLSNYGQAGSPEISSLPKRISKHDAIDIAVGPGVSFITKQDGSVWTVGQNTKGTGLLDKNTLRMHSTRTIGTLLYKENFGTIPSLTKASNGGQDDIILQIKASEANSYVLKYEKIDGVSRKNLYSYGSNEFGQLGTGDAYFGLNKTHVFAQNQLVTSDSARNEIQFDTGRNFLMWIRQGRLYGIGNSNYANLGRIRTSNYGNSVAQPNPWGEVKEWGNLKAVKVCCGQDFSVVLLDDGSVWASGNREMNRFPSAIGGSKDTRAGPYYVHEQFYRILAGGAQDIETGQFHTIVLMEDGRLMSSGDNRFGQIGHPGAVQNKRSVTAKFQSILVDGKPVVSGVTYIHAGDLSTFFTMDDSLYAIGLNNYGQLGDGSRNNLTSASKIYPTG